MQWFPCEQLNLVHILRVKLGNFFKLQSLNCIWTMCILLMLFIYLINEKLDCVSRGSVAQRTVSHKRTDIGITALVKHILKYYNIPFTFSGGIYTAYV